MAEKCISCLSPGPCRLLALCAVVRGLGEGHGDRHPLVTQHGTEASLSPAAGTACAAACIVAINVHHQPLEFLTQKGYNTVTLGWKRLVVVVVCVWVGGGGGLGGWMGGVRWGGGGGVGWGGVVVCVCGEEGCGGWWWSRRDVCDMSLTICHKQSCTSLWEPCPCGHGSRPCTCVQGPKNSAPLPSRQDRQLELVAAATQRRPPPSMNCATSSTTHLSLHTALLPSERTAMLLRHGPNYSRLLQARPLRVTLLCDMHVTEREETVGGRTRNRFHVEREVARIGGTCTWPRNRPFCGDTFPQEKAPHVALTRRLVVERARLAGS